MAPDQPISGLSFPADTFQKLAPQSFLRRHLQHQPAPTRPSARHPDAFRPPSLHAAALAHAHGSAVVRTGDTAVVCGVRAEVLDLAAGARLARHRVGGSHGDDDDGDDDDDDEVRTHSLLVPNLELGTGCSRDNHPGPPTDSAQALAERLRSLLVNTTALVPAATLRITAAADDGVPDSAAAAAAAAETRAYWVLYIDVVCVALDGNVLDAAWAAVVAALRSTRLPRAVWDADRQAVLCDPDRATHRPLALRRLAFTASFCICSLPPGDGEGEGEGEGEDDGEGEGEAKEKGTDEGRDGDGRCWILSDPDEFEESVCSERVTVCVAAGGMVVAVEKSGGLADVATVVPVCIRRARARYETWEKLVTAATA